MAKRSRVPDEFDSPWKDALQAYLPAFMLFFFSDIDADIDWRRGYESLDKEFQRMIRRAKIGKRLADKLFKVWLKDGTERWLLIHIEIQGDYEKQFPERMFDYHIAIRRMYNHNAVGLAVLCDDNAKWKPARYEYDQWGCGVRFLYRVAKILDYLANTEEMEASDNPIAAVVLAQLHAMQTRNDPRDRKARKLRLLKGLLVRKWTDTQIRELFRLIDWIMSLPDDLDLEFQEEIIAFEKKESDLEYITSFERAGIRKGIRTGLIESIAFDLTAKFGVAGRRLVSKAKDLSVHDLRKFMRFVKRAETLDEVRECLKER